MQICSRWIRKKILWKVNQMKNVQKVYQLAHLIRRQCVSTDNNVLLFNIEGNIVEFGLRDFCLITGLNCGEYPIEEIEDKEETEEDDNHRENKSKMVHDTSNKVKVVQEKTKVKIMKIATNIEKTRPKRQPKPSKKVLEIVKEQKNARGKKNDSPKPTRHSPRIKDLAPSFDLQISQL
uniref:DUF1985 domain-containing protein n=1 Tax=Cucumis melo TaxID=3656 RepID=A0A9I9EKY1_CUCME